MTSDEALAILGLTSSNTLTERKFAYRRLCRFWDPTLNPDPEAPANFRQVREAYTYLVEAPATGGGGIGLTGPKGDPGPPGNPGITVSTTPPGSPSLNDLWLQI